MMQSFFNGWWLDVSIYCVVVKKEKKKIHYPKPKVKFSNFSFFVQPSLKPKGFKNSKLSYFLVCGKNESDWVQLTIDSKFFLWNDSINCFSRPTQTRLTVKVICFKTVNLIIKQTRTTLLWYNVGIFTHNRQLRTLLSGRLLAYADDSSWADLL